MFRILGAFEESLSPLRTLNRELWIDPQDLGCLCTGLIELPQLRETCGQPNMALPHAWSTRGTFTQRGQRLRVLFQHIAGKPQLAGCYRHIKRIMSHVCLDDLDRPRRFSRPKQRHTKSPIREIGVERDGLFELGDGLLVLAVEGEKISEVGLSNR